jgi:hypothetical protein
MLRKNSSDISPAMIALRSAHGAAGILTVSSQYTYRRSDSPLLRTQQPAVRRFMRCDSLTEIDSQPVVVVQVGRHEDITFVGYGVADI